MKKKIGLGIIAVILAAGAFVYASKTSGSEICPDQAGCICPGEENATIASASGSDEKIDCPNREGCICY